jgi:precorrin-2 dehydrogenase/sirohydrochlorin ferrochelatase
MFPIALDLTRIPILLTGSGELLEKRRRQLEEYGATQFVRDIKNAAVVMVAGLPREQAAAIADEAHALGKLVNVEDINDLCDFYFTANVKRGDLIIAVSTSGASPTLARKIRDRIAEQFGEEWASHLSEILRLRKGWKAEGKGMKEVVEHSERHIQEKKWLAS